MAQFSRFMLCKPHKWHVQEMGSGPLVLLIHGAGGSTQSWRHLMPALAEHARVVAVDLPGQGFTKSGAKRRHGLLPMAQDLHALCAQEGWKPAALIGHSAGSAIALEMATGWDVAPPVVGINAALSPFKGLAGVAFPIIAKTLSVLPGVAQLFSASSAREGSVTRLIQGTGSKLSHDELRWYRALISDRGHVDATLSMMAQWELDPLLKRLPDHPSDVLLIAGENDKMVPPETSRDAAAHLGKAAALVLPELGHLAHEENAALILAPILNFLRQTAVLPAAKALP